MTQNASTTANSPIPDISVGMKRLAWQGVGLFVPREWEIGKYQGDHIAGSFRIDADQRHVVQVRWWIAGKSMSLELLLEQYRRNVLGDVAKNSLFSTTDWLDLSRTDGLEVRAYDVEPRTKNNESVDTRDERREVLVFARERSENRAVLLRFFVGSDHSHKPRMRDMIKGLRVGPMTDGRDFAVLDFAVRGPAQMRLEESQLACGVCRLHFRRKRERLTFRRYSAANAVMATWTPTESTFESWVRVAYAAEFHDMKYELQLSHDDSGVVWIVLTGKRRWLAPLEMSWIVPRHRRPPRSIIVRWFKDANKIVCVEASSQELMANEGMKLIESTRFLAGVEDESESTSEPIGLPSTPDESTARDRTLDVRIGRGANVTAKESIESGERRVTACVARKRSAIARVLRVFAMQPTGEVQTERIRFDLLGVLLWDESRDEPKVDDLARIVRSRLRVTRHEAEQSVLEYVRAMVRRGVFEFRK